MGRRGEVQASRAAHGSGGEDHGVEGGNGSSSKEKVTNCEGAEKRKEKERGKERKKRKQTS